MKKIFLLVFLLVFIVPKIVIAMPPIPVIPPFPTINSNGNTYHVDKDIGRDISNDGSSNKPWATLQHGINQLKEGDTLIVHEVLTGYNEFLNISNAGTKNNWITIKGAEGENVVLKGGKITFSNTAKYIHFNNIDINVQDAGWMLIEIKNNSQYLAISDLEINCQSSNSNYTGVWANAGVNNIWFKDMDIHHCGYKKMNPTDCSGVCMVRRLGKAEPLLDNITFLNVTSRDHNGDGIGGHHVDRVYIDGSIAKNNTGDGFDIAAKTRVVFRNTVSSNNGPKDQGQGFKTWSKESWFVNCIAFNNTFSGIHNKPLHQKSSIFVLNSTFVGNNKYKDLGQIRFSNLLYTAEPDLSSTSIYLFNNLFHTINTSSISFGDWSNQTLVGEDNNYYFTAHEKGKPIPSKWAIVLRESSVGNSNRFTKGYTSSDVENGVWYNDTGYGKNDIGGTSKDVSGLLDPGFVKLFENFRLKTGSRGIDAGANVGLRKDFNGTQIPQGTAPDIGAYELLPTLTRPLPPHLLELN